MVFVYPVKTYDFNTHNLSVEEVDIYFSKALPNETHEVSLEVYGQIVAKKTFLSKLGLKPKPQKYRIYFDFNVLFENKQVSDQSFEGFGLGQILNETEERWIHNEDLVKLISVGIKDPKAFAFVTESFNRLKPNLYLDVKRLYRKFGR